MKPAFEKILRIIAGETVFGLDTDSKILQVSNEISARLFVEMAARCDTTGSDWANKLATDLMDISTGDPSILIGFDNGLDDFEDGEQEDEDDLLDGEESSHFLKLIFTDVEAAYYQFPLFPSFDEAFIKMAARKRQGDTQFLEVTLADAVYLQEFIENLRDNPHLKAVEESSFDEFNEARSESV